MSGAPGEAKGARHRRPFAPLWFSEDARCRAAGVPLEQFYPAPGAPVPRLAARACAACPVREACLESAMEEEDGRSGRYGVRGGLTAWERGKLHSQRFQAAKRAAA